MKKESLKMKLSDLKRPGRNVRIHTEVQLKEFERSVLMFGQIRPIVVDEENAILAGNGLYETLVRLGWQEAEVYKITGITDREKKKLMLADNKVFSLGIDDLATFDAFLIELGDDLDVPGFDEDVLRSMVSMPEEVTEVISGYGLISDEEKEALTQASHRIPQGDQPGPEKIENGAVANPLSEPDDTRHSVTCPKCGELIWL